MSRGSIVLHAVMGIIVGLVIVGALLVLASCSSRNDGLDGVSAGVGAVLGAPPREPCPPPRVRVNNRCEARSAASS